MGCKELIIIMNLKLYIFRKSFIYFSIIVFSSCTENINEELLNETYLSNVDVNFIGTLHNKGLDFVFIKIKKENRNSFSKKSISEFSLLVNQYLKEYVVENGLSQNDIKHIMFYDNTINILSKTSKEENLMNNNSFSSELQNLLDALNGLSDSNKDSWEINDYLTYISDIENQANSSGLSDKEMFILYTGTSVAKNSLKYWNDHIAEWSQLFENTKGYKISAKGFWDNFNWGAIGISDAAGAVGMAANLVLNGTGAAMAATGPGGWVGIGLVVAASSIGSSATAFAAQAITN